MSTAHTVLFQTRPRRVRVLAVIGAAVLLGTFVVVAVLLKQMPTGVYFYTSDQIAMVGLGMLLATGALLFARPRVRVTPAGVEVRNMLGTRTYEWDLVEQVSFPDGSAWARLELPDDEYVPVLAVQAIDGDRTVTAMRELRRLHRQGRAGELPGQEVPTKPGPDHHGDDARGARTGQEGQRLGEGGEPATAQVGNHDRLDEHDQ